jgi:hypothetical protein
MWCSYDLQIVTALSAVTVLRVSHLCFHASSIYYIDKPTWFNFTYSLLFLIEIHSTCFGRPLHPSSGVQLNCSYSHRYISVSVWYGLNLLPDVQGRGSIAQYCAIEYLQHFSTFRAKRPGFELSLFQQSYKC